MTTSVNEIGCQMRESSRIATEAVAQAAKTDARIAALSQSAGRIGDVVKLITAFPEAVHIFRHDLITAAALQTAIDSDDATKSVATCAIFSENARPYSPAPDKSGAS